jgi:hypothetical protein
MFRQESHQSCKESLEHLINDKLNYPIDCLTIIIKQITMQKKKNRACIALVAIFFLAVKPAASGQDIDTLKPWTTGGVLSLNLAQSSFTYWAAGGQNSVALNGLINLTANFKQGKSAWDNILTVGYGKMNQKGSDIGWVKTDDRIDLQSKHGIILP